MGWGKTRTGAGAAEGAATVTTRVRVGAGGDGALAVLTGADSMTIGRECNGATGPKRIFSSARRSAAVSFRGLAAATMAREGMVAARVATIGAVTTRGLGLPGTAT